jgi:hypothetical protein
VHLIYLNIAEFSLSNMLKKRDSKGCCDVEGMARARYQLDKPGKMVCVFSSIVSQHTTYLKPPHAGRWQSREKVRGRSTWSSVLLEDVPGVATISERRVNVLLHLDDMITALEVPFASDCCLMISL